MSLSAPFAPGNIARVRTHVLTHVRTHTCIETHTNTSARAQHRLDEQATAVSNCFILNVTATGRAGQVAVSL